MKNWLKKIFSKKEKTCKPKSAIKRSIFGAVALLALVATIVAPTIASDTTSLPSPRFNFLKGDHELLTAANSTKGQSNWVDPVDGSYKADIGDEVVFRFYYHNGVTNSVARNTILRALLPNGASTQHKVLSHLDSQDTPAISDTVVDGQIVGYGNGFAEINLAEAGRLEYVPGSTKIWSENPKRNGVTINDGVTSENGINIGDVAGCWQYAGYVTFKVVVKAPADIAIEKYVAYPGTNSWNSILEDAKEGETVAWKVRVGNFGGSVAKNVLVKDELPAKLSYINGTTVLYGPNNPNGRIMPDTFTTTGFNIDAINPGAENAISIVFQTKIGTGLNYGPGGVWGGVNWANATLAGNKIGAHAKVTVIGKSSLKIEKTVWNGSAWVERSNAKIGDIITYKIVVSNIGDINQLNIKVNDVIPVYTKYVVGSTKVNGQAFADGIDGAGIAVGNLGRDGKVVITFNVLTYGCPPIGDYTLTNTAFATSNLVVGISDTAMTILHLDAVVGPKTGL